MPAASMSRDEVVVRLAAVFRDHGYQGASLARLSAATGLGRSSLYHHFPNGKEDMARAVLTGVSAWLDGALLALASPGDPRTRVERLAGTLADYYAGGRQACLFELFAVGEAGDLFRKAMAASLRRLLDALAATAGEAGFTSEEAERRAEDVVVAFQGALVVSRLQCDGGAFARVMEDLPRRLLGPKRHDA